MKAFTIRSNWQVMSIKLSIQIRRCFLDGDTLQNVDLVTFTIDDSDAAPPGFTSCLNCMFTQTTVTFVILGYMIIVGELS